MVWSGVQRSHRHKPHELRTTSAFEEVISSILYKTGKLLGLAPFLSKMKVQMYYQGRGSGLHQAPQNCSVMLAVHMSLCPPYLASVFLVRNNWMLMTGEKNLLERISYHSFSPLFPLLSILALQVCKTILNVSSASSVIRCHLIFVEWAASFICRRLEDFQLHVLCNPSALC